MEVKQVAVTWRAIIHLREIRNYSMKRWGGEITQRYMNDLERSLVVVSENSGLLKQLEIASELRFYTINRHLLCLAPIGTRLFLVAIHHGSVDMTKHVQMLEPTLLQEAAMLHRKLENNALTSLKESNN